MKVQATEWAVVIAGIWNRGILTPAGISRRLFELDENTPLSIEVPLDGIAGYKVRYEDITVIADWNLLRIETAVFDYPTLGKAMRIGVKALQNLPETPLRAAGINVRFRTDEATAALRKNTECPIDDAISGLDMEIAARLIRRSLTYKQGRLNLILMEEPVGTFDLHCHFECQSTDSKVLVEWLQLDAQEIENMVKIALSAICESNLEVTANV